MTVNGLGGNDYYAVDDETVTTTLDGGAGNDSFQIGQIYGLTRDAGEANPNPVNQPANTRDTSGGSLTPADVFGTAPRELTRAVSLQQTVQMVRTTIEVVEDRIDGLTETAEESRILREGMLRELLKEART